MFPLLGVNRTFFERRRRQPLVLYLCCYLSGFFLTTSVFICLTLQYSPTSCIWSRRFHFASTSVVSTTPKLISSIPSDDESRQRVQLALLHPPGSAIDVPPPDDPYESFSYPSFVNFTRYKKPERRGKEGRGEPGSDSYYVIPPQQNATVTFNQTAYKSRTCSTITGRRILMNYAHNCCLESQPSNCKTGLENGFDICIQYTQNSIDDFFVELNQEIFDSSVMAGYGVWKSYLVTRLLMILDDDDVLFYSDSGAEFIDSAEDYFCLMDERNQDVVVFSVGLPENQFSKGDALLLGGCTTFECAYSEQRLGGFSIYRKSMVAFNFLSTWLSFSQDLRIVSDHQSKLALDLPGFFENRHDQTALSLASKRCGIPEWPDPSQFGADGYNNLLRQQPEFKTIAKTIINSTRYKS